MVSWSVPGYVEERQLGKGATGRVVAAVHAATGQRVAIKYLSDGLMRNQAFVARFRAEAELLRSLTVPQVVQLIGYAEEPGRGAAIVMELVQGVSLHQMISQKGATSPEAALVVLKGSLLGLAAAHSLGIVHRDYKPENVLVDAEGTSKLADFGVAARAGKNAPAEGTPLYMAPEQWLGAPATPASDIYAATAVFFECLTGRAPFPGPLGKLEQQHAYAAVPVEEVAEPLRMLITRGLAKNPAYRPASALSLVADLEATALAAYGHGWDARGRLWLRNAVTGLLLVSFGSAVGSGSGLAQASTWLGLPKALAVGIAAAATALAAGATAAAVTLTSGGGSTPLRIGPTVSSGLHPSPTGGTSVSTSFSPSASPSASAKPTPSVTPSGHPSSKSPGGGNGTTGNNNGGQTTTPPPVSITLAPLTSDPSSPVSWTCGATPPAVTVTGQITSDQAATVTYQWSRSDGTSSTPATVSATAGVASQVTDSLAASQGSGSWSLKDVLEVTSPGFESQQITVSGSCTYPPLHVSTAALPAAYDGAIYSATLSAAGGDGSYQWSATGLPAGLSISPSGTISGTPSTAGTYPVTVTVTDGETPTPQSTTATLTLTVNPPIIQ
jgi:serine/threonine protein kinase